MGGQLDSWSFSICLIDNTGDQTGFDTGFKIRIPRDLPNIPDAFRKQSSVPAISGSQAVAMDSRSLSAGAETSVSIASFDGSEPIKRSHSEMLSAEPESTKTNFPIFGMCNLGFSMRSRDIALFFSILFILPEN